MLTCREKGCIHTSATVRFFLASLIFQNTLHYSYPWLTRYLGMQNTMFGEDLNPQLKLRACDRAVELVVRDVIP
jgi:hypothetical protein